MANKTIKIFIAENIPSLNKGEMTILGGMMESFKILGDVEVSMISDMPEIDKIHSDPYIKIIDVKKYLHFSSAINNRSFIIKFIDSFPILFQHVVFLTLYKISKKQAVQMMKAELWQIIAEADIIIIGHDGTFGLGGGIGTPIILYPLFMPVFTKAIHKRAVLYGGSIGNSKDSALLFRKVFKYVLGRFDLITLREDISAQHLRDINFKSKILSVTADPACLLRPANEDRIIEIIKAQGINTLSGMVIGFTLTREIASKAFPQSAGQESYNQHVQVLAKVLDRLIDALGAKIVFLPHCIGPSDKLDDRIIAKHVYEQCRNKSSILLVTNEYSAAELKGLIGHFDMFVGERIHSVVNALTMGVPSLVIASASDQRLGIIKMIGQEEAILPVELSTEDTLFNKILSSWKTKDKIRDELSSQTKAITKRSYQNGELLKQLLDSWK